MKSTTEIFCYFGQVFQFCCRFSFAFFPPCDNTKLLQTINCTLWRNISLEILRDSICSVSVCNGGLDWCRWCWFYFFLYEYVWVCFGYLCNAIEHPQLPLDDGLSLICNQPDWKSFRSAIVWESIGALQWHCAWGIFKCWISRRVWSWSNNQQLTTETVQAINK